jgi:hypothetical protein
MAGSDGDALLEHFFPGDGAEHGAVLACRSVSTRRRERLLVRRVFLARDGIDFTLGPYGYRLTALFVAKTSDWCRDHGCMWLSAHNHGKGDRVSFSSVDRGSHERLYPALLDLIGEPVGALVFASDAVAGELWMSGGRQVPITEAVLIGERFRRLYPEPLPSPPEIEQAWLRQALLLGPRGQHLLRRQRVGVIGAGGAGSLVLEELDHLGLGEVIPIDPDRVDVSNLSRIPGSTRRDALAPLAESSFLVLQRFARLARPKVRIARRVARRANPRGRVRAIHGDIRFGEVVQQVVDCDFLFCATDTMTSRLLFTILCHAFLIPGIQLGVKIPVADDGTIGLIHGTVRPVTLDGGCLNCAGAISQKLLHEEALLEADRRGQRYVDDPNVREASVISLNGIVAAHAVTDFLFYVTGLHDADAALTHQLFEPRARSYGNVRFVKDPLCPYCSRGDGSVFAAGDKAPLPLLDQKRH